MTLTPEEKAGCMFANQKLALAITPYFFNLIDRHDPTVPSASRSSRGPTKCSSAPARCWTPSARTSTRPSRTRAPLPGPRAIPRHRPLRRLLPLLHAQPARLNAQDYNFHPEYEQALRYIEAHPEIRDVLLSGGDPLLLSDKKLDHLLGRLRAIKHVEFIRIGSRIPVFLPQRITPELCDIFKKHGPIWMSMHVNHPKEATQELKAACERLAFRRRAARQPERAPRRRERRRRRHEGLVHRLLRMRVRPYYIYQMDLITGAPTSRSMSARASRSSARFAATRRATPCRNT
jgi:lysine 2,3-aminomutase